MRIVLSALGSPGHVFPLVPLAAALREAGHEITFALSPDLAGMLAGSGLRVVECGIGLAVAFGRAIGSRGLTDRPRAQAVTAEVFAEVFCHVLPRAVATDLLPVLERDRPDLVIAEIADQGAALAAGHLGLPCVLHSFGRRVDDERMSGPFGGRWTTALSSIADDLGLRAAPAGTPLGHTYLDICPPSLRAPAAAGGGPFPNEVALRPTPWNPAGPRPARPTSGRPWVYLTLGTALGDAAVLRAAAEGLAGLDVDVLVAAGSIAPADLAGLAEPAAGRLRVEPFVAQADLLGQFDLIVHHGGSGTTLGAAGAGLPQVFLPQGADQFTNAAAMTALGAGLTLAGDAVSADTVRQAAGTLLADRTARDAAAGLAAEIAAMPAPATVAARLDEWRLPPP